MQVWTINTDDREKFVQELVVHIRTDHVYRTWTVTLAHATKQYFMKV